MSQFSMIWLWSKSNPICPTEMPLLSLLLGPISLALFHVCATHTSANSQNLSGLPPPLEVDVIGPWHRPIWKDNILNRTLCRGVLLPTSAAESFGHSQRLPTTLVPCGSHFSVSVLGTFLSQQYSSPQMTGSAPQGIHPESLFSFVLKKTWKRCF